MAPILLTKDNFETEVLKSDKPVMVDFFANWCGSCRVILPIMDQLAEEVTNAKICKVNIDEQPDLASKYEVMSIPTIIVFKEGKVVNQSVGAHTKDEFRKMLE